MRAHTHTETHLVHVYQQKRLRDGWFVVQSRASFAVSARANLYCAQFNITHTVYKNRTRVSDEREREEEEEEVKKKSLSRGERERERAEENAY